MHRYRRSEASKIRNSQLTALLERVNTAFAGGGLSSAEELQIELADVFRRFERAPRKPLFQALEVRPGDYPDPNHHNLEFADLAQDLNILYRELSTLREYMKSQFNNVSRLESEILEGARRIRSRLGDLKLYSFGQIGGALHFSDSYSNTDKVEVDSKKLSEPQAKIQQFEGLVTLAEQGEVVRPRVKGVSVNETDGHVGDRTGRSVRHADPMRMFDGNPDTWFELERLDGDKPLTLEMTVTLQEPSIVNRIVLNPHHFGQRKWLRFREMSTSLDGVNYVSVLEEIPQSEWTVEDDGSFMTSPDATRFGGQAWFSFFPRNVKFVRVVLEQTQSFPVSTSDNRFQDIKQKWVVGIRDLDLLAVKYQPSSQLISTKISLDRDIKKVGLLANQVVVSPLADITHSVSVDDGQSWHDINPMDEMDTSRPEVVSFNLGEGSVELRNESGGYEPIQTLRHRITLKRNSEEFNKLQPLPQARKARGSETLQLPLSGPFKLSLEKEPDGSVVVVRQALGTVGTKGPATVLSTSRKVENTGQLTIYDLPFSIRNSRTGNIYEGVENVYVGRNKWTRVGAVAGRYFVNPNDPVYYLDYVNNRIIFGDGAAAPDGGNDLLYSGRKPDAGLPISIYLDPEPAMFITSEVPYTVKLANDHDYVRGSMRVRGYSKVVDDETGQEQVPPGATYFDVPKGRRIENVKITNWSKAGGAAPDFGFVDGITEFRDNLGAHQANKFSVDVENGRVHLSSAVADSGPMSISYTYRRETELTPDQVEVEGSDTLKISPPLLIQHRGTQAIPDAVRKIDLFKDLKTTKAWTNGSENSAELSKNQGTILPGSLVIPRDASGDPPKNGQNEIFRREVSFIDGRREFELEVDTDALNGLYSIDYRNGVLYTYTSTVQGMTLGFTYLDYRVEYGIGAVIGAETRGSEILLDDSDVLTAFKRAEDGGRESRLVRVEYDYVDDEPQSVKELEPFFTPLVRDVDLFMIPTDERLGDFE